MGRRVGGVGRVCECVRIGRVESSRRGRPSAGYASECRVCACECEASGLGMVRRRKGGRVGLRGAMLRPSPDADTSFHSIPCHCTACPRPSPSLSATLPRDFNTHPSPNRPHMTQVWSCMPLETGVGLKVRPSRKGGYTLFLPVGIYSCVRRFSALRNASINVPLLACSRPF